ncbi:MAG: helix-turn-helix transcriptional regulator [Sedimenticola sp.]
MKSLASRIKLVMKMHDLSYQGLADVVGVSKQSVYNWLSGGKIREENAKRLADRLSYDWMWIMHGGQEDDSLLEAAKLLIRTSGGIAAIFRGFDLIYVEATDPVVRFTGRSRDFLLQDSFYNRTLVPNRETIEKGLKGLVSGKSNAFNFMTQRASALDGNIASLLITVLYLSGVNSNMPHFLFIGMPIANSEGLAPTDVLETPVKNIISA